MSISTDHDLDVRNDVRDELEWSADVDGAGIGVVVEDGTVLLAGQVRDYAQRVAARRAALRVRGVRAVVDGLTVRAESAWPASGADVAKELGRLFRWTTDIPETVKAEVVDHTVTLTGQVDWDYQRRAARRAVENLRGVRAVRPCHAGEAGYPGRGRGPGHRRHGDATARDDRRPGGSGRAGRARAAGTGTRPGAPAPSSGGVSRAREQRTTEVRESAER